MISRHGLSSLIRKTSSANADRGITDIPDNLIDAVTGGCDCGEYCDNIFDEGGYTDSSIPDYYDYTPSSGGQDPRPPGETPPPDGIC